MEFVSKRLSILSLVLSLIILTGCGDDNPTPTAEETQLKKLVGAWTLSSVENDGVDRTDEYTGMTLTISGTYTSGGTYNYTSAATEWPSVSPWKASDTWKFKASSVNSVIVRQFDLQEMNYTLANSDAQLTFDFTYSGEGFNNGRAESVGGAWTFVFTK